MNTEQETGTQRRKRGRPPGSRNKLSPQQSSFALENDLEKGQLAPDDEELAYILDEEKLTPFSSLLRQIFRRNRVEITRVAAELEVTENTVYRWMNGSSEPRQNHLKRLPEVLPEQRGNLTYAINQTFKGLLENTAVGVREVHRDIYYRVVDLVATTADDDARLWQVTQAIFDFALLHFDIDKQGLAVTYANLMPTHEDGIHSLREAVMRGSIPWAAHLDTRAYLGSTTLAGAAAIVQRTQTWDLLEGEERLQVAVDEHEKSACAHPVMRAGKLAGVLVVSSGQVKFFTDPVACQAVAEYANLLALALREQDFQSFSSLSLRPMPNLSWQRAEIRRSYVNRIIALARKYTISRYEAELRVIREMETEFEELGYFQQQQQADKTTAWDSEAWQVNNTAEMWGAAEEK